MMEAFCVFFRFDDFVAAPKPLTEAPFDLLCFRFVEDAQHITDFVFGRLPMAEIVGFNGAKAWAKVRKYERNNKRNVDVGGG
mmetsp:Transcript_28204/g.77484  ORF Transcript_28204/g.77484 Transcript_28204/m.77484 type:complete len:82 (+) Transcript_28204:985-1230(+)